MLYGFIAVSGFKMIQHVNLNDNKNLFTLSVILVAGIGGLVLQIPYQFGMIEDANLVVAVRYITISEIAFALILGIMTYKISAIIQMHNRKEDN